MAASATMGVHTMELTRCHTCTMPLAPVPRQTHRAWLHGVQPARVHVCAPTYSPKRALAGSHHAKPSNPESKPLVAEYPKSRPCLAGNQVRSLGPHTRGNAPRAGRSPASWPAEPWQSPRPRSRCARGSERLDCGGSALERLAAKRRGPNPRGERSKAGCARLTHGERRQ